MKMLRSSLSAYLAAIALVTLASLVCELVRSFLAPTNMVMAYLLAVVVAAARLGLRPAILTAALSVLAFDILFVPPRFSLRVLDPEYLVTFFALFVVGVVISSLVATIHDKMQQVRRQEERTTSLYRLTRDLAAAMDVTGIVDALQRAVDRQFGSPLAVAVNKGANVEQVYGSSGICLDRAGGEIIRWVLKSGRPAGCGSASFSEHPLLFFPIRSAPEIIGVMVMEGCDDLQLVEAFAGQAAMALERVNLAIQAEEARVLREKNHLEQALLNSISHDLRTPLVTISGVLDSLLHDGPADPRRVREMLTSAAQEADRLNRFVGALLDMTRLEAGALSPRLAPCDVDEIVGCAIRAVEHRAGPCRIVTTIPPELPTVSADLALLTQALVNVLDNAIRVSPATGEITVSATDEEQMVVIAVCDSGPGVPAGEEEKIFEKFHRIEQGSGTGLGLSIARGIIEAHGGKIAAANRAEGGLEILVSLPVAPPISEEP